MGMAAKGPVRKITEPWVSFGGDMLAVSIFRAVFVLPQSLQAQIKPPTPADVQRLELFMSLSAFVSLVKAQVMMEKWGVLVAQWLMCLRHQVMTVLSLSYTPTLSHYTII